uniref:Uncharacterized protein n=2 Tax=Loa loa TaxID=7209 RepID=A0A1I7V8I6_LOALO
MREKLMSPYENVSNANTMACVSGRVSHARDVSTEEQTKCVHELDRLVSLPPGDHPRRRTFQTRADEAHLIL